MYLLRKKKHFNVYEDYNDVSIYWIGNDLYRMSDVFPIGMIEARKKNKGKMY